jgi:hypothetical protein
LNSGKPWPLFCCPFRSRIPGPPRFSSRHPTPAVPGGSGEHFGFALQKHGTRCLFVFLPRGWVACQHSWTRAVARAGSRLNFRSSEITCGLGVNPLSAESRRDRACRRGFAMSHSCYHFFGCRFRSRTPGPPPFSSMNSTPARFRTPAITASVATSPAYLPVSMLVIVLRWRWVASARSRTVQFKAPRAILICALVTGIELCHCHMCRCHSIELAMIFVRLPCRTVWEESKLPNRTAVHL